MGHREEALACALCALTLLACLAGHLGWAGVALGAAVAATLAALRAPLAVVESPQVEALQVLLTDADSYAFETIRRCSTPTAARPS